MHRVLFGTGDEKAEPVEQAGIGSVEIYTWIAACAANAAVGGKAPVKDIYAQTVEYGVAFSMVHA